MTEAELTGESNLRRARVKMLLLQHFDTKSALVVELESSAAFPYALTLPDGNFWAQNSKNFGTV